MHDIGMFRLKIKHVTFCWTVIAAFVYVQLQQHWTESFGGT
jgi:hypothetical protein